MNKLSYSSHNWLAYKINNDALSKYISFINGKVIDLGCGTAPYKDIILQVADAYFGVDWDNSYHDQSNIDVFTNLIKPLPFNRNSFDTIVSFQVMEHLPEPDIFISECYRILRPGGRILITVPFMWHIHEAPYDYFRYTRHGLQYLLNKCGFTNYEILENTGFWQMWILKLNYHSIRFARGPFKYLWIPIWWIGQVISPILDRFDHHPQETGSYTLIAVK